MGRWDVAGFSFSRPLATFDLPFLVKCRVFLASLSTCELPSVVACRVFPTCLVTFELLLTVTSRLDGPGKVESLAFPGSLLRALRQKLGGREGSYANALLALLIREGGSTSEHREGALRGGSFFPTFSWEPLLLTV